VLKHQKLWKVVEKYLMNRAISIYLINKHGSKSELFIALFIAALESSAPFFVIYKAGREPTPYW
jgi:hypothetical protein